MADTDMKVKITWCTCGAKNDDDCRCEAPEAKYCTECKYLMANCRCQKGEKKPLDVQIGGDHYKGMAIQPMEYSMKNNLNACQHTAIKYISRYKDKNGKVDLEKAIHCIEMLIQMEYGNK